MTPQRTLKCRLRPQAGFNSSFVASGTDIIGSGGGSINYGSRVHYDWPDHER